ncbi:MAG: hypothetical protein JWR33_314 [Naasia sp.]|uniref:hypothetical protein n=1 Tax=Naasia sp. TaxID=2546198 RepID=UPI00261D87D5|nr:hypothetical protein [Naasia sp.]MCU1569573.1 hypothetical protein [Naasia sp.]
MTAYMLQLFPELTNVNGDAENALVLARRAQWAGLEAEVVPLAAGAAAPALTPTAIVLGSGVDSSLERTRDALEVLRGALTAWIADDIPVIAVGTGLELLGRSIQVGEVRLEGLGLFAGDAVALPARAAGELLVDSAWGTLVGYENHARGFPLDGATALGTVLHGTGNGDGTDGIRSGSVFGTHLHGPVLARNPAFATAVMAAAFGEGEDIYAPGRADSTADLLRADAIRRLTKRS